MSKLAVKSLTTKKKKSASYCRLLIKTHYRYKLEEGTLTSVQIKVDVGYSSLFDSFIWSMKHCLVSIPMPLRRAYLLWKVDDINISLTVTTQLIRGKRSNLKPDVVGENIVK